MPFVPSSRKRLSRSSESPQSPLDKLDRSSSSSPSTPTRSSNFAQSSDNSDNDVPLSLSFLRRPSRSNSATNLDVEKIMKMNTLLNSKLDENNSNNNNDNNDSNNDDENCDSPFPAPPLPIPQYDDDFSYFHPLVRKKSGELVKSSLKLNTLGTSKSAPTTPRQVHFGMDIAVKYFDEKDRPNSISAGNSPYNSDNDDDDGDDYDSDSDSDGFGNSAEGIAAAITTILNISRNYIRTSSESYLARFKRLMARWELDSAQFPKVSYRDEIDQEAPVFLERCFLNAEKTELLGHVAVKNLSYTKSITLRYTYDDWETVINVDASYIPDLPRLLKKAEYDRFLFKVSVPMLFSRFSNSPTSSFQLDPYVQFCIRYVANGQEFWDNNHNKNYKIKFTRKHKDIVHRNLEIVAPKHSSKYLKKSKSFEDTTVLMKERNQKNPNDNTHSNLGDFITELKKNNESGASTSSNSSSSSNETENTFIMTPSNDYDNMFSTETQNIPPLSTIDSPGTPLILKDHADAPSFTDLMGSPSPHGPHFNKTNVFKSPVKHDFNEVSINPISEENISPGLSPTNNDNDDDKVLNLQNLNLHNSTSFPRSIPKITAKATDPTLNENSENVNDDSTKFPEINSDSYQHLLKKYCFYNGPTTVSSFLDNTQSEPREQPPHNFRPSFY